MDDNFYASSSKSAAPAAPANQDSTASADLEQQLMELSLTDGPGDASVNPSWSRLHGAAKEYSRVFEMTVGTKWPGSMELEVDEEGYELNAHDSLAHFRQRLSIGMTTKDENERYRVFSSALENDHTLRDATTTFEAYYEQWESDFVKLPFDPAELADHIISFSPRQPPTDAYAAKVNQLVSVVATQFTDKSTELDRKSRHLESKVCIGLDPTTEEYHALAELEREADRLGELSSRLNAQHYLMSKMFQLTKASRDWDAMQRVSENREDKGKGKGRA